jgi:hypothetical protein
MSEAGEDLDLGIWADDWNFWGDTAKLSCVGYNGAIDHDALGVLRGIAAGKFCDDIATELNLPRQYVELLQSIFCSVGWADYGTSPRGCWIDPDHKGEELIGAYAAYMKRRWGRAT